MIAVVVDLAVRPGAQGFRLHCHPFTFHGQVPDDDLQAIGKALFNHGVDLPQAGQVVVLLWHFAVADIALGKYQRVSRLVFEAPARVRCENQPTFQDLDEFIVERAIDVDLARFCLVNRDHDFASVEIVHTKTPGLFPFLPGNPFFLGKFLGITVGSGDTAPNYARFFSWALVSACVSCGPVVFLLLPEKRCPPADAQLQRVLGSLPSSLKGPHVAGIRTSY